MRLLLVNPSQPGRRGFSGYANAVYPPLGLGVLVTLTHQVAPGRWDIVLEDSNFREFAYQPADLVAFTSLTATMPAAIKIAARYRARGTPTVIGGAHASACPEEAARYFDAVVVGEAEAIWDVVLQDFERGRLRGIYTSKPTEMVTPDRHLFSSQYPRDTIQTTRGCPRRCPYCSVASVFGKRYRSRDLQGTLDDLDSLQREFFVVDDNFIGFSSARRARVVEILEHLIEQGNERHWYCQTEIAVAEDPELLKLLWTAGCRMLFIGIEAEDEGSMLRDTGKREMPSKEAIATIQEHKICVLGSFILGFETDTPESLRRRVEFIHDSCVGAYQVSVMTPLPGTALFERLKDQLLYTNFPEDWKRYDFVDTPYVPPGFDSPQAFREVILECWKSLYSHEAVDQHVRHMYAVSDGDRVATGFAAGTLATYRGISVARLREEGVDVR